MKKIWLFFKQKLLPNYPYEIALISFFLVFFILSPHFGEASNIRNIFRQFSPILLLALGQTFVLLLGAIDLTQGAIVGLSSILFVFLAEKLGLFPSVILVVVFFIILGSITGFLIGRFQINSLVMTLAMMFVIIGINLYWTGGTPITDISPSIKNFLISFAQDDIGIFPICFLTAVIMAIIGWIFLKKMVIGLQIYAVGCNKKAAQSIGISVNLVYSFAFAMSAFYSVIAAIMLTSRVNQGNPQLGEGLLFESIGGAVLGGVALSGGIGSVWAATRGVALLSLIQNGLDLTDLNTHVREVAIGIMIICSSFISYYKYKRRF